MAAGFLLLLLLFVQGGKLLHDHGSLPPQPTASTTSQLSDDSGCDICDYQLTKEATQVIEPFAIATIEQSVVENVLPPAHPCASIGLCYSDRGPPAV